MYILPQVKVFQYFDEVQTNTVGNQNAFIFGPNYSLYRYSNESEKEFCKVGPYTGAALSVKFGEDLDLPANSSLDRGFVKVFFEDAIILDEDDDGASFTEAGPASFTTGNVEGSFKVGSFALFVKDDSSIFVTKILGREVTGSNDSQLLISVEDTIPFSSITDATVYQATIVPSVEIPSENKIVGSGYNWKFDDTDANKLNISQGIKFDEGHKIVRANAFVEYRALLTDATDAIHAVHSASEVASYLGKLDPDNPLAYGVYKAALNAGGRSVYYMATEGTDLASFNKVLERAELTSDVYGFVPLSQDTEVLAAVEAHIKTMSNEVGKRWRIGFFCAPVEPTDPIYNKTASLDGTDYSAYISDFDDTPADGQYTLQFTDPTESDDFAASTRTKCLKDLVVGDTVRYVFGTDNWGHETYETFTVTKLVSNSCVKINKKPSRGSNPEKVEVYHNMTYAQQAERVASNSKGFANRRIYNIFPTQLGDNKKTVSGVYAAAAVAGLTSSMLPQQPLTNVEVEGFDDIPLTYQTFTREQLDHMAELGTFILMQDAPGEQVYVRHQLSTARSDNNLFESELSLVKNLDSISYYFAEAFEPFIGKYNITEELMIKLESVARLGLVKLETTTSAGLYGPQILADKTKVVEIYQGDPDKDHVYCTIQVELPKPFNVMELKLYAV